MGSERVKGEESALQNLFFRFPLRWLLLVPLLSLFVLSSISITFLFNRAARQSMESMIGQLTERIELEVREELNTFLNEALHINTTNKLVIEKGLFDPYRAEEREPMFALRLEMWDGAVMSFFGDPAGEFYGARRSRVGSIEVVKNNGSTGGASRYFSIDSNSRAEEFIVEYPGFDCRTRPWYQVAVEKGRAVFSPVYKHFVFDDLAVTASLPIYKDDGTLFGVLGVDYLLTSLNSFLQEILLVDGMVLCIVEADTGLLVANSELAPNFFVDDTGAISRIHPAESSNPSIRALFGAISTEKPDELHRVKGHLVSRTRFEKENLLWDIRISIPEAPFLGDFLRISRITAAIIVIFILVTMFLAHHISGRITRSIKDLSNAAEAFIRNHWSSRVPVRGNNEIARLSLTLNTMAGEIEELLETLEHKVEERTAELNELNATKDRLFAIIAHDLRGPLTASSMMLDHLLEEYGNYRSDELETIIRTIGESQRAIYLLLENLLLWARSQRKEVTYHAEALSPDLLVQEAIHLLQGKAMEKELDIQYTGAAPQVSGDRNMIATVIRNLLSNAVKYSTRGGRIEIFHETDDGKLLLGIRDSGVGMDEKTLSGLLKIDERRSMPGTEGETGTGLGLVLCSEFLSCHGSVLNVESTRGEGSLFTFRLPLYHTE